MAIIYQAGGAIFGTSQESKPVTSIYTGYTFTEMDTHKVYFWYNSQWTQNTGLQGTSGYSGVSITGASGAKGFSKAAEYSSGLLVPYTRYNVFPLPFTGFYSPTGSVYDHKMFVFVDGMLQRPDSYSGERANDMSYGWTGISGQSAGTVIFNYSIPTGSVVSFRVVD